MKTIAILTRKAKINSFNTSFSNRDDLVNFQTDGNYFYWLNPDTGIFEKKATFAEGIYLVYDQIKSKLDFNNFFKQAVDILIVTHNNVTTHIDFNQFKRILTGNHIGACKIYPPLFEKIQTVVTNPIDVEKLANELLDFDSNLENFFNDIYKNEFDVENSTRETENKALMSYLEKKYP